MSEERNGDLVPVHGGLSALVDRVVPISERAKFLAEAEELPKIRVTRADLSTVHRIADGGLSPLGGPMRAEAYHRALIGWFINELRAQEVVDVEHLQELLEAMLELIYNAHRHREIKMSPTERLANRQSSRRMTQLDLERAFFFATSAKPDRKTGEVKLPSGRFRVPKAFAEQRSRFLYHSTRSSRAVLVTKDGREIELQPFVTRSLSELRQREMKRGTGQLQKLVDLWRRGSDS